MSDPQIDPAAIAIQAGRQRVWNDTARDFSDVTAIAAPAAEVISDRLIALAHVAAGQRVLDIATGVGDPALTAARIVGPSGSVVGIDHAPQMLVAGPRARHRGWLEQRTFHRRQRADTRSATTELRRRALALGADVLPAARSRRWRDSGGCCVPVGIWPPPYGARPNRYRSSARAAPP